MPWANLCFGVGMGMENGARMSHGSVSKWRTALGMGQRTPLFEGDVHVPNLRTAPQLNDSIMLKAQDIFRSSLQGWFRRFSGGSGLLGMPPGLIESLHGCDVKWVPKNPFVDFV